PNRGSNRDRCNHTIIQPHIKKKRPGVPETLAHHLTEAGLPEKEPGSSLCVGFTRITSIWGTFAGVAWAGWGGDCAAPAWGRAAAAPPRSAPGRRRLSALAAFRLNASSNLTGC